MNVLSLEPNSREIGYAYFEYERLVDWGIKQNKKGPIPERILKKGLDLVNNLVSQFDPNFVILPTQSPRKNGSSRYRFLKAIRTFLDGHAGRVIAVSNIEVRRCFRQLMGVHRVNKQQAMIYLAQRFPEIRHHLPLPRKCYQPRDYWTPLFDAIARAVAFFENPHGQ